MIAEDITGGRGGAFFAGAVDPGFGALTAVMVEHRRPR
jgi:hypothetical protein